MAMSTVRKEKSNNIREWVTSTKPHAFLRSLDSEAGKILKKKKEKNPKGSTASLAGGVGTGALLVLAGYLSLQAFHKRKNSYFAFILETAIAALLTYIMGQRYMRTGKIMPAGIVAGISFVMTGFYLYKLATGGNHIPPKKE